MEKYIIAILTVGGSAMLGAVSSIGLTSWKMRRSAFNDLDRRLDLVEREQGRRTRILNAMEAYADETLLEKLRGKV